MPAISGPYYYLVGRNEQAVMAFVFANDVEYAKPLIKAGWDMVAIGTDASWFSAAATKAIAQLTE
jgi:4-hydroxy-2-oxoheptanedioate aldolase